MHVEVNIMDVVCSTCHFSRKTTNSQTFRNACCLMVLSLWSSLASTGSPSNPKKRCVCEKLKALAFDYGNVTSCPRYIKHDPLYVIPRGWYYLCLSISFVLLERCRSDGRGTKVWPTTVRHVLRTDLKLLYISQYKRAHHALLTQPFETSVCG